MSEAQRLAEAYADAVATHRLESLYGTSKSYTLEKARERDEAHESLAAELRRLSAELEKVRNQALEDAAKVCSERAAKFHFESPHNFECNSLADAIRAMKKEPQ